MTVGYLPRQPIQPGHYVYEHWRLDTEVPFYVGAGKDGRAWAMWAERNAEHHRILRELRDKGLEPVVLIVEQGLTKTIAHRHEHALVKEWRERGIVLANVADLPDRNAGRAAKLKSPEKATAKARGDKRYFTGKLCTNGHIAERYVSNNRCAECAKEDLRQRRKAV